MSETQLNKKYKKQLQSTDKPLKSLRHLCKSKYHKDLYYFAMFPELQC